MRDNVDTRVIAGVRNQTGQIINTMANIGGFPTGDYPTISRPAGYDTDLDGMSNAWELVMGLNPNSSADRNLTNLSPAGYTNLEVFLNSLVVPPSSPATSTETVSSTRQTTCNGERITARRLTTTLGGPILARSLAPAALSSGLGLSSAVPEPGTCLLAIFAAGTDLAAGRRRRLH